MQPLNTQRVILLEVKTLLKASGRQSVFPGKKHPMSSNLVCRAGRAYSRHGLGPRPQLILRPVFDQPHARMLFVSAADFGQDEQFEIPCNQFAQYQVSPRALADRLRAWFDNATVQRLNPAGLSVALHQRLQIQPAPAATLMRQDGRVANWAAVAAQFPRWSRLCNILQNAPNSADQISLIDLCEALTSHKRLLWSLAEFGLSTGGPGPAVSHLIHDLRNQLSPFFTGVSAILAAYPLTSRRAPSWNLLDCLIKNDRAKCTSSVRQHSDGPLANLHQEAHSVPVAAWVAPQGAAAGPLPSVQVGGFSEIFAMPMTLLLHSECVSACLACGLTANTAMMEMYDEDGAEWGSVHVSHEVQGDGRHSEKIHPNIRLLVPSIVLRQRAQSNWEHDLGNELSPSAREIRSLVFMMLAEIIKQALLDHGFCDPVTGIPFMTHLRKNRRETGYGGIMCLEHRHLLPGQQEGPGGLLARFRGIVTHK